MFQYLNLWKDNKIKLIKYSLEKDQYFKKICEIMNKYEYEANEENYLDDKKLLTDIEVEIKKNKNKTKKYNKANKILIEIEENLMHLKILSIHGGKIYKIIQKYCNSFSIQEFKILLVKFYHDNKFDELERENNSSNLNKNNSESEEEEEENSELDDNENSQNKSSSTNLRNNYINKYSQKDLSLLLNFFYNYKLKNLLSKNNLNICNNLKISLFFYYLREINSENKKNYDLYKKILLDVNNLLSNSIFIGTKEIPPIENILNENWNKLIYLSNKYNNKYLKVIKDISENKDLWEKFLKNSSNKEIANKIAQILNENKDINDNEVLDILIIISFVCPLKFAEIKEYLMSQLYEKNIENLENHYTLKGFINSNENSFNNVNQKPLIIIESNKQNIEQKMEYIKTILYPKLISQNKIVKGLPMPFTLKSSIKISIKNQNNNANNNLIKVNDKNIQNNNIVTMDSKENAAKSLIIKDNLKNNFDNIIQFVKTGGLIIINNINLFDISFFRQIFNIINDAKSNKYLDKSFRLILTISEPFINEEINQILLNNCTYFNVDLYNNLKNYNFK